MSIDDSNLIAQLRLHPDVIADTAADRIEELSKAENERDDYNEALQRIVQWADAYPLEVFPKPDFKRAHEVLKAAGISLDAISAECMRHVVEGVGRIARAALQEKK